MSSIRGRIKGTYLAAMICRLSSHGANLLIEDRIRKTLIVFWFQEDLPILNKAAIHFTCLECAEVSCVYRKTVQDSAEMYSLLHRTVLIFNFINWWFKQMHENRYVIFMYCISYSTYSTPQLPFKRPYEMTQSSTFWFLRIDFMLRYPFLFFSSTKIGF